MDILAARVDELAQEKLSNDSAKAKREQIEFSRRGGKVRTYNFIDSRVTDHRTGRKTGNIAAVMRGKFELMY